MAFTHWVLSGAMDVGKTARRRGLFLEASLVSFDVQPNSISSVKSNTTRTQGRYGSRFVAVCRRIES